MTGLDPATCAACARQSASVMAAFKAGRPCPFCSVPAAIAFEQGTPRLADWQESNSAPRNLESAGANPSLVEWLRAQLDEDERVARAATPSPWFVDANEAIGDYVIRHAEDHYLVAGYTVGDDTLTRSDAEHVTTWQPARVLAEIAAKRAVLDFYSSVAQQFERVDLALGEAQRTGSPRDLEDMRNYARFRGELVTLGDVLTILAQPYRDRPGFREEWSL